MKRIVAEFVTLDGVRDASGGEPGHRLDATDQIASSGKFEVVMRC